MKREFRFALILIGALSWTPNFYSGTLPDDRIWIFQMKEDPTMPQLLGDPATGRGFYGFELDEYRGLAAVAYRDGDRLYRVELDLKVKGNELWVRYKKRQKKFVRQQVAGLNGATRDVIYPIECSPEDDGWRHGLSFGKKMIRRDDELGLRLAVGDARFEYQNAISRCSTGDCGSPGCGAWGVASTSATLAAATGKTATEVEEPAVIMPLNNVLMMAKIGPNELLSKYAADIDVMLPANLNDLTVLTTSYRTASLPFPYMVDPLIAQRVFAIGAVSKRYKIAGTNETINVEVQPLLEEYQPPAANKCGTWDSDPSRKFIDVAGKPAMYVQPLPDPAATTTTVPPSSELVVCGKSIVIWIQASTNKSIDVLTSTLRSFPTDEMERLVGSAAK